MPTYGYVADPPPLTQEELDALAAEQAAMGGTVPAGGYVAEPVAAPAVASPVSETAMANPAGTTYGAPSQPAYIPESSAPAPVAAPVASPVSETAMANPSGTTYGAPPQPAYIPESSAPAPVAAPVPTPSASGYYGGLDSGLDLGGVGRTRQTTLYPAAEAVPPPSYNVVGGATQHIVPPSAGTSGQFILPRREPVKRPTVTLGAYIDTLERAGYRSGEPGTGDPARTSPARTSTDTPYVSPNWRPGVVPSDEERQAASGSLPTTIVPTGTPGEDVIWRTSAEQMLRPRPGTSRLRLDQPGALDAAPDTLKAAAPIIQNEIIEPLLRVDPGLAGIATTIATDANERRRQERRTRASQRRMTNRGADPLAAPYEAPITGAVEGYVPPPEPGFFDRLGGWIQSEVVEPGTRSDPAIAGLREGSGDGVRPGQAAPVAPPRQTAGNSMGGPGERFDTTNAPLASMPSAELDRAINNDPTLAVLRTDGVVYLRDTDIPIGLPNTETGMVDIFGSDVTLAEFEAERARRLGGVSPPPEDASTGSVIYDSWEDLGTLQPVAVPAESSGTGGTDSGWEPSTDWNTGSSNSGRTSSGGGNYRGSGSYSGGSGRTSTYRGGSSSRSRGGGSTDSGEQGDDLDRDFTADDFLEQAGGNRIKAQMLANIANSRKRRGRLRNVPQQRSSMRDNILRAIQESLTRPRTR